MRRAIACGLALYLLQAVPLSVVVVVAGGDPFNRDEGFGVPAQLTDPARVAAVVALVVVLTWTASAFTSSRFAGWHDELVVAVPLLTGVTYCALATGGWGVQARSWDTVWWGLGLTAMPLMAGWVAAGCGLVFAVRTRRACATGNGHHGSSGSGHQVGAPGPQGDEA